MNQQVDEGGILIVLSNADAFTKLLAILQHATVTLFSGFTCNAERIEFNVYMKQLMKALELMSVIRDVSMEIRYPGSQGELCFRSSKSDGPNCWREYVKLKTMSGSTLIDFADTWCTPEASFITQGQLLKSLMEDMPPIRTPIVLLMQKDPVKVALKASRQGLDLEFEVPSESVNSFQSELPTVEQGYSHKVLKTALCNVPSSASNTKVSIDGSGLLKVMHILNLQGGESLGGTNYIPNTLPTYTGTSDINQGQNNWVTIWFLCKAQLVEEEVEPVAGEDAEE
eukprot:TRINITY_DN7709_c3_g1_i9.p1 TRINITY_DN7709_c3_g1~~TRINITY_DN7709_c3_g1_i9.p1  ORF type:complete len:283 (+),score=37.37 TRINITY_DN7709_c3_g1_i9:276-1124(+)